MPSGRTLNPAQAHHKAEKARTLKKSKAALQAQRTEKLARRNPVRLERQIEDLKAAEADGSLRPKDRQTLEQLEKDAKAIRKAREKLGGDREWGGRRDGDGDKGRQDRRSGGAGEQLSSTLGKRRRGNDGASYDDDRHADSSSSATTDEDVRNIPMPRDTPPPLPARYAADKRRQGRWPGRDDNPNNIPLPSGPHPLPAKPTVPAAQTVYEAKPAVRDLRKEATARFVPAAVTRKKALARGEGRLMEEAELDGLQREGYLPSVAEEGGRRSGAGGAGGIGGIGGDQGVSGRDEDALLDEEQRFEAELRAEEERLRMEASRNVQMEDVADEDL